MQASLFWGFYIPNRSWLKKNDEIHRTITAHILKITAHIYVTDIISQVWFKPVSLPLRIILVRLGTYQVSKALWFSG